MLWPNRTYGLYGSSIVGMQYIPPLYLSLKLANGIRVQVDYHTSIVLNCLEPRSVKSVLSIGNGMITDSYQSSLYLSNLRTITYIQTALSRGNTSINLAGISTAISDESIMNANLALSGSNSVIVLGNPSITNPVIPIPTSGMYTPVCFGFQVRFAMQGNVLLVSDPCNEPYPVVFVYMITGTAFVVIQELIYTTAGGISDFGFDMQSGGDLISISDPFNGIIRVYLFDGPSMLYGLYNTIQNQDGQTTGYGYSAALYQWPQQSYSQFDMFISDPLYGQYNGFVDWVRSDVLNPSSFMRITKMVSAYPGSGYGFSLSATYNSTSNLASLSIQSINSPISNIQFYYVSYEGQLDEYTSFHDPFEDDLQSGMAINTRVDTGYVTLTTVDSQSSVYCNLMGCSCPRYTLIFPPAYTLAGYSPLAVDGQVGYVFAPYFGAANNSISNVITPGPFSDTTQIAELVYSIIPYYQTIPQEYYTSNSDTNTQAITAQMMNYLINPNFIPSIPLLRILTAAGALIRNSNGTWTASPVRLFHYPCFVQEHVNYQFACTQSISQLLPVFFEYGDVVSCGELISWHSRCGCCPQIIPTVLYPNFDIPMGSNQCMQQMTWAFASRYSKSIDLTYATYLWNTYVTVTNGCLQTQGINPIF